MVSRLHKNAILIGYVDSFCLVCESHLRCEDDINVHIGKPIHEKNLNSANYVDKFKDDCVRKVKKGYFCEFCNLLLTTAAKVTLHIAEKEHIDKKGSQLLRRVGNSIIAFDDILINEKAWNGLTDDTCALCSTEFDNEDIHKTEQTHILNLIQSKIEFDNKKSVYRKIDGSSFHCLTCNLVLALSAITTHFDQAEHIKLYAECRQPTLSQPTSENLVYDGSQKQQETQVDSKGTEKNDIKKSVDFDNAAKKTSQAGNLEKARVNLEKATVDMDDEVCKALGAKDYICYNDIGKKCCILCDWVIESVAIESHVHGRHHQTILKMHKERLQKEQKSVASTSVKIDAKDVKTGKAPQVDHAAQENKSKISDSVFEFQKNDININFERETAVCKKCSKNVDFVFKKIESHIEEHRKKTVKKESKPVHSKLDEKKPAEGRVTQPYTSPVQQKRKDSEGKSADSRPSSVASPRENDEEIEKFAKQHDFVRSHGDSKMYCRICDTKVPSSLKSMKEHINGISHKNKATKVSEFKSITKPVISKQKTEQFIQTIVAVENLFLKDVVINEKFCLNIFSLLMITKQSLHLRCQACEVNLNAGQVDMHIKTSEKHMRAMIDTPVLINMEMESEFVREVRPGLYHCGFCNQIEENLEDLDNHFKSTCHREGKTSANWRLQQYMPQLMINRQQQEMEIMFLMRRLMGGNLF